MPCAIVLGCPPYVAFMGPQKLPVGVDEFTVAGGLAGSPINVVRAKSVDLLVPAESEIVIEGLIDTEYCEPEAPFGESHGHVALEEYNMPMRVTAITQRRNPVIPSYISQVAPSESSVIKRVAYEQLFLAHLREALAIRRIKGETLHAPLTGLLRVTVISCEKGMPRTELWRALRGARGKPGRSASCRSCARRLPGSAIRSATGCRNGTKRRSAPSKAAISRTARSARKSARRASNRRPNTGRNNRGQPPVSNRMPHPVCIFH